ncbi:MAG TPA: VOC family protein [Polyangiaceae bacterium]|nr:VOC family protein [Polyangiaceae bacterium]
MLQLLLNIDVGDLERAEAFYTTTFELRVARRLGPDVVELIGAAAPIYLLRAAEGSAPFPGAERRRSYGRHWTPVHLDFVVPDLVAALERAVAAGATLEGEPRHEAWGKLAVLADPWGNGFCLLQFMGRGYDELVSPSAGVDAAGELDEAQGELLRGQISRDPG